MAKLNDSLSKMVQAELNKREGKPAIKTEELKKAQILFKKELHPYFLLQWGELWTKRLESTGGLQGEVAKVWIHALTNLTKEDVANGIANFLTKDNASYPPAPLRFRQLACEGNSAFNAYEPAFRVLNKLSDEK